MNRSRVAGFSLIEILLSIATIAVIAGISVPVYQSFQVRNDASVTIDVIAQTLRRAQLMSQAMESDSSWGVSFTSGSVTLFKGISFASRDTDFDEVFLFSSNITISGLQEIIFSKMEGLPQSQGSINLLTNNGISKTLTINTKGILEY